MRRVLILAGVGVLALAALALIGWFLIPYLALWLLYAAATIVL